MNEGDVSAEKVKATYKLFRVDRAKELVIANMSLDAEVGDTYRVTDGKIPLEFGNETEKKGLLFRAVSGRFLDPGERSLRAIRDIEV